jgi:hypothetical protein
VKNWEVIADNLSKASPELGLDLKYGSPGSIGGKDGELGVERESGAKGAQMAILVGDPVKGAAN